MGHPAAVCDEKGANSPLARYSLKHAAINRFGAEKQAIACKAMSYEAIALHNWSQTAISSWAVKGSASNIYKLKEQSASCDMQALEHLAFCKGFTVRSASHNSGVKEQSAFFEGFLCADQIFAEESQWGEQPPVIGRLRHD